ncbi:MAG TPA: TA system VapC family ribonuclease toxin [Polyangia bacterium]|jgi:hypothetical protein
MIAADTNLLVHAHRHDSEFHVSAKRCVAGLAEGSAQWAIPYHCLVEFYGIVTHPAIWKKPSTPQQAADQIRAWRESPVLVVLTDEADGTEGLLELLVRARIVGPKVHDARIAAVCLEHRVSELWTLDRDFSRFPALVTRNPLAS